MASIYESAQQNFLNAQSNANFGRMTQSKHDAAGRYAEANNMDYDPKKGYGAKGSFKTQKAQKVRDPRKGEFKGGAAGFAALGNALMGNITPGMTNAQKTIEMGRRFGGMFTVGDYKGYNPYKLPANSLADQQKRQMAIASFERGHGYTPQEITYGKNGGYTARDVTPAAQNTPAPQGYRPSMGDVTINGKKYNPSEVGQIQQLQSKYAGGGVLSGDEISKAEEVGFFNQDTYSQLLGNRGYQLGADNTATYSPELYAQKQFSQSLIGDREQTEFDRLSRQHEFNKSMSTKQQQEDLAKRYQSSNLPTIGTSLFSGITI